MANIADCLQSAVAAGELNPVRANEARAAFRELEARYRQIMPAAQAAASAAADLKEATSKARRARFHTALAQLQALRRLKAAVLSAPDPAVALRNLLEWSEGSGHTGESVHSLTEAYQGRINAIIQDVLREHRPGVVGELVSNVRNRAAFDKIVDELHGTDTGDATAKQLAKAIRQAQDEMRRAFNAHGGDIGHLADYGLAHSHDTVQLRRAGFAAWAEKIEPRLAWDRIDDVTTGRPFTAQPGAVPPRARTERFLRDVYEGITSRGWDDREPSLTGGGRALYNRRADHRVLHFRTGADWLAYNAEFGSADPFSALVNGLHGLARDVALMRVLGPNPRQGLQFAIQVAMKQAETLDARAPLPGGKTRAERFRSQGNKALAMLSLQNGDAGVPGNLAFAQAMSGARTYLTSVQMAGAVVSSVTDYATMHMAAKVAGLNPWNVFARSIQLTASAASRETAARMGFVAETLANAGAGTARYFGKLYGTGIADRLANFTLRASGLTFLTDMRKVAFQMEFAGHLADQATRGFADLDPLTRRIFEARGIGPADWDALREPATHFIAPNGASFITGHHWIEAQTALPRAQAEGLAMRLDMAVREQLELAVPTASLEGRAAMLRGTEPGTLPGEFMRSVAMYKSFTASLMLGQMRRIAALPDGAVAGGRWGYAAQLSASLLLLGGLAVQLKEIAKGRDPRPMTELKFWEAALLQGGGLGIFGDFFAAEQSRVGGGLAETMAGPVIGLASDLTKPIASNLGRAVNGDSLLLGRDVANLARRNTPFASSVWYGRLGFDRLVADQVQRWLDPEAERLWRQQERRRENDYGTRSWWAPGTAAPQRGPDLANVAGASQ